MKHLSPLNLAGNQIVAFRVENLASLPGFGSEGRLVMRTSDHTLHFDTGTAWLNVGTASGVDWSVITNKPATFPPDTHAHAIADVTGLQASLDGKSANGHVHTASQITDLTAAVNTLITTYFDDATADTTRDTLVELIGLITTNQGAIATLQSKADIFSVNAPSSTGTSAAITHNLNSTDVIVQVFEIATNQMVICDVTRTNANVVTLSFGASQAADTLRVVVMG